MSKPPRHSLLVGSIFGALVASGCGAPQPPAEPAKQELPTVDVTAAPDAAYSTADDRIERRRTDPGLAGVLPDGFPADIPVFRPSSLVDFAAEANGGGSIVFSTAADADGVAAAMAIRLRSAGWQEAGGGTWTKAARRLRLVVQSTPAGSRFRIEF